MLGLDPQLGVWTSTFMAVMLGVGKLVQLWRTTRTESSEERRRADDTLWTRRDQMIDDQRADLAACRSRIRELEDECVSLRRQRDEAWHELDKNRWPKIDGKPEGDKP
jgi:membrane protein involved in colicin uptake